MTRREVLILTAVAFFIVHLPLGMVEGAEQFIVEITSDEVFYNSTGGYYKLTISPDAKTSFLLKVRNTSPTTQQFVASISGTPQGWRIMFENQQTEVSFSVANSSSGSFLILVIPSSVGVANVTISVTSLTYSVTENLLLRIFCEEPAISFSTPGETLSGPQGGSVVVDFSITNNLQEEMYLNLSLDGIAEGSRGAADLWVGRLSEKELHLSALERRELNVTVFIPENATVNQPQIFSVVAYAPSKDAVYRSQPIKINPQPFYWFTAEYVGGVLSTFPGEAINFTIRVNNLASIEDTFTASVLSLPQGWSVECLNSLNPLNFPVKLSPGEKMSLYFRAQLPTKTVAGEYFIVIEFSGEMNTTTATVPVTVMEQVNVALQYGPGLVGGKGGYYPLYIHGNQLPTLLSNLGNSPQWVEVNVASFPEGWTVYIDSVVWGEGSGERVLNTTSFNMSQFGPGSYSFSSKPKELELKVPPYVEATLNLYVEAPAGTSPGVFTMALKATYLGGKRVQVLTIRVKLILAQLIFEDMNGDDRPDILVEPSNKTTIRQGDWVTFTCRIKNIYPYPAEDITLYLDIGDNSKVKSYHIDHMEPGEERDVKFRWRAIEGVYTVRIYAEGGGLTPGEEPQVFLKSIEIKEGKGGSFVGILFSTILLASGLILLLFFFYLLRQRRRREEEIREEFRRERYRKVYGPHAEAGEIKKKKGRVGGKKSKKKHILLEE